MHGHRAAGWLVKGGLAAVFALTLGRGGPAVGQGVEDTAESASSQPVEPAMTQPATTQSGAAQLAGPAETQPAAATAAEGTYWLRATAAQLNIRSRADLNSPVVLRVPANTLLHGTGEEHGWHAVVPPEGAFSYVSAEFIDRRGDDVGVVSVRSGRLRARVGSRVVNLDPTRSEVQALLERGERVKILEEEGSWLRIAPPPAVRVYVHGEFVERLSSEEARRFLQSGRAAVADAVASTQPAAPAGLAGPWGQKLRDVEEAIAQEAVKPPMSQRWAPLIGRLRPIAWQREEPLPARLAEAWIAKLERRNAEREALEKAEEIMRRAERERRQHEQEMERIERLRAAAGEQALYDARGILMRSEPVGGGEDAGRWFRLLSTVTDGLEAYVYVPPDVEFDAEPFLGRNVGVRGAREFNPQLGADFVRARGFALLPLQPRAAPPATGPR